MKKENTKSTLLADKKNLIEDPNLPLEQAIEENMNFIYKMAHKYKKHGEFEELVQEGIAGLIDAYWRRDASKKEKNTKFLSYAFYYIRMYMLKYVNKKNKLVNFTSLLGTNEYNNDTVTCWVGDGVEKTMDHEAESNDNKDFITKIMNSDLLDDREKFVISNRFLAHEKVTFKVLAEELKLSIPMVKIIEANSLKKLKKAISK